MQQPFGEVIASSTREFIAEVYREADPPAFGSWVLVKRGDGVTLLALVSQVEVESYEPNRRAIALGRTPDELRREMPQVLELLRTTCRAQVLAYRDSHGLPRQTLPPHPAEMHAFVYACLPEDVQKLGQPFDFLRTLVRHPDPSVPVDDLLVAVLQQSYAAHDGGETGRQVVLAAGRVLGRLLNEDHERLQSVLRRVQWER